MVFTSRWSVYTGGLKGRFYCILCTVSILVLVPVQRQDLQPVGARSPDEHYTWWPALEERHACHPGSTCYKICIGRELASG